MGALITIGAILGAGAISRFFRGAPKATQPSAPAASQATAAAPESPVDLALLEANAMREQVAAHFGVTVHPVAPRLETGIVTPSTATRTPTGEYILPSELIRSGAILERQVY